MRLDKFSNPIFNSTDLFDLIYQGKLPVLDNLTVDADEEIACMEAVSSITFQKVNHQLDNISIEDYDRALQSEWFIPDSYKNFDMVTWLYQQCTSEIQCERVNEELTAFVQHDIYDLLIYLKYFVDTMTDSNILWGVGRGSSVSSYVLFLIGVHSIDSIRYELDWREFLR